MSITSHRLSGDFDPTKYTIVEHFDHSDDGEGECVDPLDSSYIDTLQDQGYDECHCTHCGSALKRGGLFRHSDGELVVIGETCQDRLNFSSASEIAAAHREQRLYLANRRKVIRANWKWGIVIKFLEDARDSDELTPFARSTCEDILKKLLKYFSISRKQLAFARRLVAEAPAKIAAEKEAAERAAAAPAWEAGRQAIEGEVLSIKWVENDFGGSTKCLVQLKDGRKCYGTCPSAFEGDRGDQIKFTGTISLSRDDHAFAFFSRPKLTA